MVDYFITSNIETDMEHNTTLVHNIGCTDHEVIVLSYTIKYIEREYMALIYSVGNTDIKVEVL